MLISRLPSGGGKGELHGAIITVSTSSEFIGLSIDLYLGSDLKASKTVSSTMTISFVDIMEAGEYTVKGTYDSKEYTDSVTISAENILNKDAFGLGLYVASASIKVIADEFIGQPVELIFGGVSVSSGVISDDGIYIFRGIKNAGAYTAKIGDTESTITVSDANIDNNETVEVIVSTGIELVLGTTYSFAGYDWTCAEEIDGGYVLQSQGIIAREWPGYALGGTLYNGVGDTINVGTELSEYHGNIFGYDISNYRTFPTIYNSIKKAEKMSVYGKGLYLVSSPKAKETHYIDAYKISAGKYSQLGGKYEGSWTGTVGSSGAVAVNKTGTLFSQNQGSWLPCAPAFNLDKTKVYLDGTTILIK